MATSATVQARVQLLLLLAARALACNPQSPTPSPPFWGFGGPTQYDLAFRFFEYPLLLCGAELPQGREVDANRLKVHLSNLPMGDMLCKFRAPFATGIVQGIIDVALEYRLAITMDQSTYFNVKMRQFDCIRSTNISYYVFDFFVTYGYGGDKKEYCNFKRGVFGGDWKESSYPIATINFEFPGFPVAVCRPLEDPSQYMEDVTFIHPFFLVWGLADVPFGCIFRKTKEFEHSSTAGLIKQLSQKVDLTYYFVGEYPVEAERLVEREPEVVVPYSACDDDCEPNWYRWRVEGPSGRSTTCCFLPNTGPPARHCYRPYRGICLFGYLHRSDGRCCSVARRPRRQSRELPFIEDTTADNFEDDSRSVAGH